MIYLHDKGIETLVSDVPEPWRDRRHPVGALGGAGSRHGVHREPHPAPGAAAPRLVLHLPRAQDHAVLRLLRTRDGVGGRRGRMMSATVVDLLRESCDRWPDRTLLAFEDGLELTRRDVRELVERFAATLRGVVAPGERVVICTENRAEYLIAFLAVLTVRGAVVPLNPASGPGRRPAHPPHVGRRARDRRRARRPARGGPGVAARAAGRDPARRRRARRAFPKPSRASTSRAPAAGPTT